MRGALHLPDLLASMPAQPLSARRVLDLVDDPSTSTADLARLVEADPILAAQVLRLANATYYGVSGQVGSARRAVVLLGFSTVRAMALTAVCGLVAESGAEGSTGPWAHAVVTGLACSVIAERVGVASGDAFSIGLLHDVGTDLLAAKDPTGMATVLEAAHAHPEHRLTIEHDTFGTTHPAVGAHALAVWRFPAPLVRAVAQHHAPVRELDGSLAKVLVAGEALGRLLDDPDQAEPTVKLSVALSSLGLFDLRADELLDALAPLATDLRSFLVVTRR